MVVQAAILPAPVDAMMATKMNDPINGITYSREKLVPSRKFVHPKAKASLEQSSSVLQIAVVRDDKFMEEMSVVDAKPKG